jgi:serine/threonine protein kinase
VALKSKYLFRREGPWNLWVHKDKWTPGLWEEVLRRLEIDVPGDRPKTEQFYYSDPEVSQQFYLKIYHQARPWGFVKDLFRDSQAFRALKQGEALSESGFHVPFAVAAGEERNYYFLRRAFLLTVGLNGILLPYFLQNHYSLPGSVAMLKKKRRYLRELASEIRRLHQLGFVHGDLTPFNILIQSTGEDAVFCFMDNDRTRRYPRWLPQLLWRRNLVQLNRFLLPGISLQDRVRFLTFYLWRKTQKKGNEVRLIRWVEAKTRKRIREWDLTEPRISFRRLMKWEGSFDKNSSRERMPS